MHRSHFKNELWSVPAVVPPGSHGMTEGLPKPVSFQSQFPNFGSIVYFIYLFIYLMKYNVGNLNNLLYVIQTAICFSTTIPIQSL